MLTRTQQRRLATISPTGTPVAWSRTIESLRAKDFIVLRETPAGLVAYRGSHMTGRPHAF